MVPNKSARIPRLSRRVRLSGPEPVPPSMHSKKNIKNHSSPHSDLDGLQPGWKWSWGPQGGKILPSSGGYLHSVTCVDQLP
jgi:hypothetical protein